MLRKTISINLYNIRSSLNISQQEVSNRTGIPQKSICKIENCKVNFSIDKLDEICKGLELPPYELILSPGEIVGKNLLENKFFNMETIRLLYIYYTILRNPDADINTQIIFKNIIDDTKFMESLEKIFNIYEADPKKFLTLFENDKIKEKSYK